MIRNWAELSVDELNIRQQKLIDWVMANPNHEKSKKAWQAIGEIANTIQQKKNGEADPYYKIVMDLLF